MKIFANIIKRDDEKRMVYGYASTEALDGQGERVSKAAIEKALPDYMRFANVREMHQPSAVGVTKSAEIDDKGLYIQVKVVDNDAWDKVKEEVYKGFSIGGKSLSKTDDTITELKLTEISLVDRPANPEAIIDVWKADDAAPPPADQKAAVEELGALVNQGKITPAQLLDLAKRQFSQKERDEAADKGQAMPDGSFPIKTVADLKNAIKAFGRAKDKAKAKAHIIARAKALKATDELPADWRGSTKDDDKGKAEGASTLRKSMYSVGLFAQLLDQIACMQQASTYEAEYEGDGSDMPEKLKAWVTTGCQIFCDMADEESSELMGALREPGQNSPAAEVVRAEQVDDLAKAGAKFSKETKEKLATAHKQVKKAAGHLDKARGAPVAEADGHLDKCAKCIGKADEVMASTGYAEADDKRTPADDDDETDSQSSAGSKDQKSKAADGAALAAAITPPAAAPEAPTANAIAKAIVAATEPLHATIDTLTKRLAALEAQPMPPKGPTRAVGKTEDNGTGADPTPAIPPVLNADGSVNKAATEVKHVHAAGPVAIPRRTASVYFTPRS